MYGLYRVQKLLTVDIAALTEWSCLVIMSSLPHTVISATLFTWATDHIPKSLNLRATEAFLAAYANNYFLSSDRFY